MTSLLGPTVFTLDVLNLFGSQADVHVKDLVQSKDVRTVATNEFYLLSKQSHLDADQDL